MQKSLNRFYAISLLVFLFFLKSKKAKKKANKNTRERMFLPSNLSVNYL